MFKVQWSQKKKKKKFGHFNFVFVSSLCSMRLSDEKKEIIITLKKYCIVLL